MSKLARSPVTPPLSRRLVVIAVLVAIAALSGLATAFVTTGLGQVFAAVSFVALSLSVVLGYHWLRYSQRQQAELVAHNQALLLTLDERTNQLAQLQAHGGLEQQRIDAVLRETGHRIGNSLATVSSLLALQSLRTPSDGVREALEAARHRVHAIASSHRRVRSGQESEIIPTDEFLPAVIDDLSSNLTMRDRIVISSHVEAIPMTTRYATTLAILLSELVTNAIKHAFIGKAGGEIVVRLERLDGVAVLSVIDDGIGMPNVPPASASGLGLVLVKQLAGQFGGVPVFEYPSSGGTRVIVPLPRLEAGPTSQ